MPDLVEQMYCSQQIFIPPNLPSILKKYAKAAIRTQPGDLLAWSSAYFQALAEGIPPPAKDRIEYPPVETPSGLSPGFLKVLINQIGKRETVQKDVLAGRWKGVCLNPKALQDLLDVGMFEDEVSWLEFLAICVGTLEPSLTRTMMELCELLTDEPEGGRASIPVTIFLNLYKYLAKLDCGPVNRLEQYEQTLIPDTETQCQATDLEPTEEEKQPEEVNIDWDTAIGVIESGGDDSDEGIVVEAAEIENDENGAGLETVDQVEETLEKGVESAEQVEESIQQVEVPDTESAGLIEAESEENVSATSEEVINTEVEDTKAEIVSEVVEPNKDKVSEEISKNADGGGSTVEEHIEANERQQDGSAGIQVKDDTNEDENQEDPNSEIESGVVEDDAGSKGESQEAMDGDTLANQNGSSLGGAVKTEEEEHTRPEAPIDEAVQPEVGNEMGGAEAVSDVVSQLEVTTDELDGVKDGQESTDTKNVDGQNVDDAGKVELDAPADEGEEAKRERAAVDDENGEKADSEEAGVDDENGEEFKSEQAAVDDERGVEANSEQAAVDDENGEAKSEKAAVDDENGEESPAVDDTKDEKLVPTTPETVQEQSVEPGEDSEKNERGVKDIDDEGTGVPTTSKNATAGGDGKLDEGAQDSLSEKKGDDGENINETTNGVDTNAKSGETITSADKAFQDQAGDAAQDGVDEKDVDLSTSQDRAEKALANENSDQEVSANVDYQQDSANSTAEDGTKVTSVDGKEHDDHEVSPTVDDQENAENVALEDGSKDTSVDGKEHDDQEVSPTVDDQENAANGALEDGTKDTSVDGKEHDDQEVSPTVDDQENAANGALEDGTKDTSVDGKEHDDTEVSTNVDDQENAANGAVEDGTKETSVDEKEDDNTESAIEATIEENATNDVEQTGEDENGNENKPPQEESKLGVEETIDPKSAYIVNDDGTLSAPRAESAQEDDALKERDSDHSVFTKGSDDGMMVWPDIKPQEKEEADPEPILEKEVTSEDGIEVFTDIEMQPHTEELKLLPEAQEEEQAEVTEQEENIFAPQIDSFTDLLEAESAPVEETNPEQLAAALQSTEIAPEDMANVIMAIEGIEPVPEEGSQGPPETGVLQLPDGKAEDQDQKKEKKSRRPKKDVEIESLVKKDSDMMLLPTPITSDIMLYMDGVCDKTGVNKLSQTQQLHPKMSMIDVQVSVPVDETVVEVFEQHRYPKWMHIPGIGPTVPDHIIEEAEKYFLKIAELQEGMVMPRNIKHFHCPPLELVPEYPERITEGS